MLTYGTGIGIMRIKLHWNQSKLVDGRRRQKIFSNSGFIVFFDVKDYLFLISLIPFVQFFFCVFGEWLICFLLLLISFVQFFFPYFFVGIIWVIFLGVIYKSMRSIHFTNVWPYISLWIKPTDALNSSFIGITTLHVSGSLSAHHQEFLAVHRLWYILCSCDDRLLPGVGWDCSSLLLLVAYSCIKCTKADVRLRTPDDVQKGCPKQVES